MSEIIGPATIVVSQSFSAFAQFLPPLSQVRKADPKTDPDIVGDVRMGEIAAMTLAIGVGAILSNLTRSAIPAFVALLMSLILVMLYEAALAGDRPGNPATSRVERKIDA